jgi:ferredoxin-type protein NapG
VDRRSFVVSLAQGLGLSTIGGLMWSGYVDEAKASSSQTILRPPGAIAENDFVAKCIKCGLCVENCPYDTLVLAKPGDHKPIGTPYFIPRDIPCYMCDDIPCVPVCPSGALDEKSVTTNGELDITISKMGLAVVDTESCIAFWGIQCDACHRACPVMNEAITLEFHRNPRTGKHAFLTPVVHSDACTGCGKCELACVTEKPAIFILPLALAQGKAGANYIKGWDESDEGRLENIRTDNLTTTTEISKEKAVDSLNDMGGLFDE